MGLALADAGSLVVGKEEGFVLAVVNMWDNHGTANGSAKLILAELTLLDPTGVFKELGGVKFVVAQEFPNIAVELIRAGLDRSIQYRASPSAYIRRVVGGLQLEFAQWRPAGEG